MAEESAMLPRELEARVQRLVRLRLPRSREVVAERFRGAAAGLYPFETPEEQQYREEVEYQVRHAFEKALQRIERIHEELARQVNSGKRVSLFASQVPAGARKRRVSVVSLAQAAEESAQRYQASMDAIAAKYTTPGVRIALEEETPLPVITPETAVFRPAVRRKTQPPPPIS